MPGTIQVSVLDLLDFPSSSSSTISIKVSMGKREFQTWDKGDFSFPLTSLHENIVVTILDIEGKVLSRTGVETILVIEKGTWDDFFVLEGGGRLHMKLQFILSNVERKRIQELREIALKKKQKELLIKKARHLETVALANARSNAESLSMSLNHEVTDSSEMLVQVEAESSGAESLRNADKRREVAISGSFSGDAVLADQLEHPVKDSITISEEPQIHHAKAEKQVVDKIKTQVSPLNVSTSSGEGTLSTDVMSEDLQIPQSHEKVIDSNETRIPPDTPAGAISSLEALDTRSIDHSVSDTNELDLNLNESKTMSPPADIPARPISLLEEVDSRSPEHSVRRISSLNDLGNHSNSSKFGEVQMLNKNMMLVPPTDAPVRRISSHEDFGDHSRSSKLEEDRVVIPEKPTVVKRTPSNVRKMISAFETGQAKGQAIRADPPFIRTQPIKSKFNIAPAETKVKEVMETMQTEETGSSSFPIGISQEVHLQQSLNHARNTNDAWLEQNGKEAIAAEMGSSLLSTVKTQERNLQESDSAIRQQIPVGLEKDGRDKLCEQQPSEEQLMEEAISPRQLPVATRLFETDQHPNIEARLRTCVKHIEESSCDKTKVIEYYRANKYPFGSPGSCILTDESRHFCITTGSKQLMNLVGGSSNCSETDLGEKSSYQTDATNEQNLHHNICNEVNKNGNDSGDKRKWELEGPLNVFEGLIGQAGKIAAIAAFGALVIFARER